MCISTVSQQPQSNFYVICKEAIKVFAKYMTSYSAVAELTVNSVMQENCNIMSTADLFDSSVLKSFPNFL